MDSFRKLTQVASVIVLVLACVLAAHAQVTTGNVRGTVTDPNGAVVPNAKVTLTQKSTNFTQTAQTSSEGTFEFNNLQPAADYVISVEAANFKTLTLNDVHVSLNQTTDVPAQLTIGAIGETVEVTAGGAELVDTTTANLSKSFESRQVVELAQTSVGASGVNNLALIAPNVSSSGGIGVGSGGSVGGQRPRNNNFMIDGIDNNDKGVTGPQSYISPEEVAEFTLLQNQFSAEFGRSNGGQFLTVTKSGTNDFHGSFYGFFRNRHLNALDTQDRLAGVTRPGSRFDYFRGGYNLGGPVFFPRFGEGGPDLYKLRNKLYFFTSYERLQRGLGAPPATPFFTPTAQGFATLNSGAFSGFSARNLAVFNQFVPVAPSNNAGNLHLCTVAPNANGTCSGTLINVPIGTVKVNAPNFNKQNHAVINLDYTQSTKTQHRIRFTFTNLAVIDNAASLPIFFISLPQKQRLFSYTLIHNFSSNLIDENRIAFRRSSFNFPVPSFTFPGLNAFPNLSFDDLGLNVGPDPNAPQFGIENNYQIVNNLTWLTGNHTIKFGGDFRNIISPQGFTQRVRGDYEYGSIDTYLRDFGPDIFGERNAGNNTYYGNQHVFYGFFQDDWRFRPNLTLNLGVSYSYQQVPTGASSSQQLNAIASVPGLLEFRAPTSQKKNFGPHVGFAYSPNYNSGLMGRLFGTGGKTSIRAGFSLAYDYIFDNLYILSNPPQLQQTYDCPDDCRPTAFLANGGLPDAPVAITSAAAARAQTGSFIPDQQVPYSMTWTGSIQRQFLKDWSLEVRYLGTRGVHLLTQNRINVQPRVAPYAGLSGLPTFLSRPSQAQLDALSLTLAQIQARPRLIPRYSSAGFTSNVVAFLSNGNSTYHGASALVQKRFTRGFSMSSAYTWSHLIDDTTAEVFSTVLTPRRVQDFQNLRIERADSALDHRHRFVTAFIYELPFYQTSDNHLARTLIGGWQVAGTYTWESGEKVTVRSGNDSNLNGDAAGDRAILNTSGQEGVGSTVTALTNSSGAVVAYLANNPNAKYIQAGAGAVSNIGRNTFSLPPINNIDFSIFKNFRFSETRRIQLRADMFNAFNHPQYVAGSVNTVDPIATTGVTRFNAIFPVSVDFLRPGQTFSSNPRVIQMALRFDF